MSTLKERISNKESELKALKKELSIFNEFKIHLKEGDLIHIPEISYDPFGHGYFPLEVQGAATSIYCIERSINKEHYIDDLSFYIRNEKGEFISSNSIDDASLVKEACKINRKHKT